MQRWLTLTVILASVGASCSVISGLDEFERIDEEGPAGGAGGTGGTAETGGGGQSGSGGGTSECTTAAEHATIWARSGAGPVAPWAGAVAAGNGGDVWIAGAFTSQLDLAGEMLSGTDAEAGFWMRLNGCGEPQASGTLIPTGNLAWARVNAVAIDTAGNAVIAGAFRGTLVLSNGDSLQATANAAAFVIALSPTGGVAWSVIITGDGGDDEALTVAIAPDGSVVVGGFFVGTLFVGPLAPLMGAGEREGFVVELSPTGAPRWRAGILGADWYDEVHAVAVSPSHVIGVAGTCFGPGAATSHDGTTIPFSAVEYDAFAGTLDQDGSWTHVWIGGDSSYALGLAGALDSTGENLFVAGHYSGDGFDFGGMTALATNGGQETGFVAKLNVSTGSVETLTRLVPDDLVTSSRVTALALDPVTGHLLLGGALRGGAMVFDQHVVAPLAEHALLARVDQQLTTAHHAVTFGDMAGAGSAMRAITAERQTGNTVAAGMFNGTVDFGVRQPLTATGESIFVLKAAP